METILPIVLLSAFSVMLVSLSGVLFVTKNISEWTEKNISYLVTFSAGVFLVISYNLVFEAIELSINVMMGLIFIIFGFLFLYLMEHIYPESHCHHSDKACVADSNKKKSARKVLMGDAIHNVADGILLVPAFVVNIQLGIIATFGILIHEFVQEVSEFFILKGAGYSNKQALVRNFLVSGTILIGILLSFLIVSVEVLIGPILGISAGAFIYIVVVDLIPETIKHSHKKRNYFSYMFWLLLGILVIMAVNLVAGH